MGDAVTFLLLSQVFLQHARLPLSDAQFNPVELKETAVSRKMPPIAAVDVLGHLPGPVSKTNAGAGDLLAGEVFAYAVSSSIAVVDVSLSPSSQRILLASPSCWSCSCRCLCYGKVIKALQVHRMQLACVLHGGHRSAAVTAVAWWVPWHSSCLPILQM